MSVRTLPAGKGCAGCNGARMTIGVGAVVGVMFAGIDAAGCCAVGVIVGPDCCGTTIGAGCFFETGAGVGVVAEGRGTVCCCAALGVTLLVGLTVRGRVAGAPLGVCACVSAGTSTNRKNTTLLNFIIYGNLCVLGRSYRGSRPP